jgi:hypothetical protein
MRSFLLIAAGLAALAVAPGVWAAPPRTAEGRPELSGVWTNASLTKLTRPTSFPSLVVSPPEAAAIARRDPMVRRMAANAQRSDPNDALLADGNAGEGYNTFWIEPGQTLAVVKGQHRTSWIVDPPDGQLPLSAAGRQRIGAARAAHRTELAEGPEALMPWDRCLIGSRGSGGPGMLNNIYNSNYQIVQAPDAVAIVVEMIHDVRTIPIFASRAAAQAGHAPAALHPWLGDSTAWWEGDALVVETVHVHPEEGASGPIYLSADGRVTERFTRVSDGEIFYEFAVEDPAYYTRPWRAEMTLSRRNDQLYEYACHEGNYAMTGVLAGARKEQAEAGEKAAR